jgi:outer membrane protein assembly factor BamD (BamD/ComL family)
MPGNDRGSKDGGLGRFRIVGRPHPVAGVGPPPATRAGALQPKLRALAIAGLTLLAAGSAPLVAAPTPAATELPSSDSLYEAGVRALDEGLPQVAVYKLRAFLQNPAGEDTRAKASLALARALLQVGDPAGALAALAAGYPQVSAAGADASFWFGQVYAALGRWPEALDCYARTAAAKSAGNSLQTAARFGQAEALLALERTADAAAAFKRLIDDPRYGEPARLRCAEIALDTRHLKDAATYLLDAAPAGGGLGPQPVRNPYAAKEHAYLLGRLRLANGQPALAEEMFRAALADPDGLSERLLVVSHWGWAQACLDQQHLDQAEDALEFLIDRHPKDQYLPRTFAWLEELYESDPAPDLSELRRWSDDATEVDREAQARLALGGIEAHAGRTERAEEIFAGFGDSFPDHPLRERALFDLAGLQLRLGRLARAHATVEAARAIGRLRATGPGPRQPQDDLSVELEALDARISLAENDSATAAKRFEAVSQRAGTGAQAEAAAFDAVLGWLRAMDGAHFAGAEQDFQRRFPQSKLNAEFLLEEGLARAGQTAPGDAPSRQSAAACLRQFLREQPSSPRAAEAHVALAELAFDRPRPNVAISWREIDTPELRPTVVSEGAATPGGARTSAADAAAEQARASYLAIWLADAPGPAHDEDKAIALARQFLEQHANSSLAPEARMKLCEIYFRREDYPEAQTQLELLTDGAPDSPLAEPALYLAGLAASRSMSPAGLDKAMTLFEAAAHRDGPLKLPARLRQAEVQNRLGNAKDARTLYDGVIAATADHPLNADELESRCEALSGRGETLFAQAANEPALYGQAAQTFQLLAQTPGASLLWRRQALTQQGRALEKLGDNDAALAAYDDALNASDHPAGAAGSPATSEPEWAWFYRAGTDAARLLEAQSQWTAAIAIYKKLAAADGPRKSEFENQLTRRRLEHFIWEE